MQKDGKGDFNQGQPGGGLNIQRTNYDPGQNHEDQARSLSKEVVKW